MTELSVCLIVRNEANILRECLASVARWADEICVMDTGSTDGTIDVARSFGAKLGQFTWCDDFSRARNASLELATKPWILMIDADEVLIESTGPALREAIQSDAGEHRRFAYFVTIDNLDGARRPHPQLLPRLFRNHPAIRFVRPLHESIMDSVLALSHEDPPIIDVRIEHRGYMPQMVVSKNKHERNLAIMRKYHAAFPDDLFNAYKLGHTLSRATEEDEQLSVYAHSFMVAERLPEKERKQRPYVVHLYEGYAAALMRRGSMTQAREVLNAGLTHHRDSIDLVYRDAEHHRRIGDRQAARLAYSECVSQESVTPWSGADPTLRTIRPLAALARLALDENRLEEASTWVQRALELEPRDVESLAIQVELLFLQSKAPEAVKAFESLLTHHAHEPRAKLIAGEFAWAQGEASQACDLWRAALGTTETGQLARVRLAMHDLAENRWDEATAHLPYLSDVNLTSAAWRVALSVIANVDVVVDAAYESSRLRRELVGILSALVNANAEGALVRFARHAPRYESRIELIGQLLVNG